MRMRRSLGETHGKVKSAPAAAHLASEQAHESQTRPQWTRLAFVGLLAGEMSSGGSRFNFPMSFPQGSSHSHPQFPGGTLPDITWPHINLALLGAFIAILAIVGIVFVIVMAYISSVMRFILFDSVLTKQCRIR